MGAQALGLGAHVSGHLREGPCVQAAARERVGAVGVEAGGDQQRAAARKGARGGQQNLLEAGRATSSSPAACRNGQVDREALSRAGADVLARTGARKKTVLVDARVEDLAALSESLGGAVAVVDVPVHDQDPLQPSSRIASSAATATPLNRQKPIARPRSA